MRVNRILSGLWLLAAAQVALGQANPAVVNMIVDEGKNHNQVMNHLKYLCKKIGPRLTSSPQLEKACKWTADQFKKFGCQNVRIEQWGEFPVGFERGKRQVARMIEPEQMDFQFTTASWTYGTHGAVRGPAIAEPTTQQELQTIKDRLKGAWIISTRTPFRGRGAAVTPDPVRESIDKALDEAGIAGRVFSSGSDLVITSGRYNVKFEEIPRDLRITVRKQDHDAILSRLAEGTPVTLEFDIENKLIKGPRPCYNVIADIPGAEKPDEMVIISGHLDSWDGPGSEGAQDNGTGTMVALEAARILGKVGAKPKRTVRFILWSGEEEGLLGSAAYVKKHPDELDKISAVFVDDGGTNYEGGVSCLASEEAMLKEALEPAMKAFPDMPVEVRVVPRIPRGGGSDHASFNAVGVPGFFWFERGRGNYRLVHHTQNDRYETAIPEYLVQSSTNSAAASYILACAPTLLPREPKPTTTEETRRAQER